MPERAVFDLLGRAKRGRTDHIKQSVPIRLIFTPLKGEVGQPKDLRCRMKLFRTLNIS